MIRKSVIRILIITLTVSMLAFCTNSKSPAKTNYRSWKIVGKPTTESVCDVNHKGTKEACHNMADSINKFYSNINTVEFYQGDYITTPYTDDYKKPDYGVFLLKMIDNDMMKIKYNSSVTMLDTNECSLNVEYYYYIVEDDKEYLVCSTITTFLCKREE